MVCRFAAVGDMTSGGFGAESEKKIRESGTEVRAIETKMSLNILLFASTGTKKLGRSG